jgi:hypothetical protein
MDSFGNYPRERPFDPFSVMLFKALQVVAFLFFLALLVMNPEAKQGKIDTKAEFIVTMTWPDNHPDDIDLYVPAVEVIHYDTITLDHAGQEKTAVRFRVAQDGSVTDINHLEKSLVQLTRSVRRNSDGK